METVVTTISPEETQALGRRISDNLRGGENLMLVGDLGSGKTALTQGLADGLGIIQRVKSPTYVYLQEYELPLRSTRLAHYDVYRLPDSPTERDLQSLDLPDRTAHQDTITVVEWGERLAGLMEIDWQVIRLTITGTATREIRLPKKLLAKAGQ